MYSFIGVSFTLKGQSFERIEPALRQVAQVIEEKGNKPVLVHGFMPKHVVLEKGFRTEVVDALEDIFPLQINCYRAGQPLRKEMAELLREMRGEVYFIGDIKDGVQEEFDAYKAVDLPIHQWTFPEL